MKKKRYWNARDAYLLAGRLSTEDDAPWRRAGEVSEKYLESPELAKTYFAESLRRRPTQPELIEKLHGKEARKRYEKEAEKALERTLRKYSPLGSLPGAEGDPAEGFVKG